MLEIASSPIWRESFGVPGCSSALILYLLPIKILCVLATYICKFNMNHDEGSRMLTNYEWVDDVRWRTIINGGMT